jgi:hypothetical protein
MEIDMRNYKKMFAHSSGRLVGVGIPDLRLDLSQRNQMLKIAKRRKEDPEFDRECIRKSVMRCANTKALKKPVTLPKLKCLEKNPES